MTHFRLDDEDDKDKGPLTEPNAFLEAALFKARTVLLTGGIDFKQAQRVSERLLALSAESMDPILLVLSSPGGHVESGDMIHDAIRFIDAPVQMLGTGWVASAGALIYCAVPRERRLCLPNTRFLLHEPRGGVGGMASDVEIQAREILRMRDLLEEILANHTGQPIDRIHTDTDRDFVMEAPEALAYGIIDDIISSRQLADRSGPIR